MSLTFLAFSNNPEPLNDLRTFVSTGQGTHLLGERNNPQQFLADITLLRPSAAVVVLSKEDAEREFALIKQIVAAHPNLPIITASRESSSALILRSMRSGAHEFLELPIVAEEFRTVVE